MSTSVSKPKQVLDRAEVRMNDEPAGYLDRDEQGTWRFHYLSEYSGPPVSLTLPTQTPSYEFESFPSVFEGLLPEGVQLEALLRTHKIDRNDAFRQLVTVGEDLVGAISVHEVQVDSEDKQST